MVDVSDAFADIRYRTAADRMPRLLATLLERRPRLEKMAATGETLPVPELRAPVPRPPKLIAAFGNYLEGSYRERQTQDMFLESPDSVIGPNETVVLPNHPASIFHHEAELGLVVGQRVKDLPADERALEVLAFISSYMTLVPGDVIMCGTNHQGLGVLQDGDQVEMSIDGIGTLAVSVRDPQRREWPRGVDEEMAARQRAVGTS